MKNRRKKLTADDLRKVSGGAEYPIPKWSKADTASLGEVLGRQVGPRVVQDKSVTDNIQNDSVTRRF